MSFELAADIALLIVTAPLAMALGALLALSIHGLVKSMIRLARVTQEEKP